MPSERSSKVSNAIDQAVQSLYNTLSTSYGPKGMDKMLIKGKDTIITNDGATIMKFYKTHPIHRILSNVSSTQDSNCGDGTTSVVLLIGCIMDKMKKLKEDGIHPSKIVDSLEIAKKIAIKYIEDVRIKIEEDEFMNVALTALNSKIASKSNKMAEIAIKALKMSKKENIKIMKRVGGNIDDIELIPGILLNPTGINNPNNSINMKMNVMIVQFSISAPKTNLDSKIIINDYSLMEKFVKEEREYIINIIKKIKDSGANLLIIQKSIIRESCSELAIHFLKKIGISVIDKVERSDIEFLSSELKINPVTDVDLITKESVKSIDLGYFNNDVFIRNAGCSILVTGCDQLVIDEAERSLNDVLCVIKALFDEPYIVPGGGSIETGIACQLENMNLIMKEIGQGFLGMPYMLANNSGLYSSEVLSNLKKNIQINKYLGISLRTGFVADMVNDDNVIQPALVSKSVVVLAIETVQMLIRIDDILPSKE